MWKRDDAVRQPGDPADLPATDAAARRGDVVMDLGKTISIKGELSASEDLTLYGHMEGSITLGTHTLTIGPHADIKAAISAKTVVIMGSVTGNVTAGQKVEVGATGSVTGDIKSPRLAVLEGGMLRGKVEMPKPPARPAS